MISVHQHIEEFISRKRKGDLFFTSDFKGEGTAASIKMALSRISQSGKIRRLAQGIYYTPKMDPMFGALLPSPEQVAEQVAKKEKVKIKPAGVYALHKLGLSTQVPTQLVYITDGEDRQIKMGKTLIRFKGTTPKKMSLKGPLSSLVIQALEELDLDKLNSSLKKRIQDVLMKEESKHLKHDLKLAPNKIHDFIVNLLKE